MINDLPKLFKYTVDDGILSVCLDRTGVWVYSDCSDSAKILAEYQELKHDLALAPDQVNLVTVGCSISGYESCTPEDVYANVLEKLKKEPVLSRNELLELLECYGLSYEPAKISDGKLEPGSDFVEEVFGEEDGTGSHDVRHAMANKQYTALAFVIIGIVLLVWHPVWWLPIFPFVIGWLMAMRVYGVFKSFFCQVIEVLCVVGLILTIVLGIIDNFDLLFNFANTHKGGVGEGINAIYEKLVG